jgi:hypothetical protein
VEGSPKLTASKPASPRSPSPCSQWETTWKHIALFKRGWTNSAIARHLERDQKTVRSYLSGERSPGARRPAGPDALAEHRGYVAARCVDDPHLWATALYDEVVELGYGASYVSFPARYASLGSARTARRALG